MDVCIVGDCRAPIVHGVPLCHHCQLSKEDHDKYHVGGEYERN